MRKTIVSGVIVASLSVSGAAFADEPRTEQVRENTASAPAQGASKPTGEPVGQATLTSAEDDGSAAPVNTNVEPKNRDSVTLYQTVRPNKPLLFLGGGLLVGSYVTTAAVTAASDSPGRDERLYIPIVGPWASLADGGLSTRDAVLTAGSGVIQGAGAAFLIASFLVPERIPAATIQAKNVKLNVAPTSFGAASAGLGAVGTF